MCTLSCAKRRGSSHRLSCDHAAARAEPDLSVPGHPEIFIAGDLAAVEVVPGIAPAAKRMGRHAALDILNVEQGKPTRTFRYRDYGQLATIRRNAALAILGKV
jgi:NADH dehydrogenase